MTLRSAECSSGRWRPRATRFAASADGSARPGRDRAPRARPGDPRRRDARDGRPLGLPTASRQGLATPILLLTARDAIADRVAGLDAGADDYLVKPFAPPELAARVRALTRRHAARRSPTRISPSTRRRGSRRARGTAIELTARESELLELLLRNARGRRIPRAGDRGGLAGWRRRERRRPLRRLPPPQAG